MFKNIQYTILLLLPLTACVTTSIDPRALEFENKCVMEASTNAPSAENTCSICLQMNPKGAQCLLSMGKILFEVKRFDEAIKLFKDALASDPKLAIAHNNLGAIYYTLGKYSQGVEHFLDAALIDPTYTDARMGAALCYYRLATQAVDRDSAFHFLMQSKAQMQAVMSINPEYPGVAKALATIIGYIEQLS